MSVNNDRSALITQYNKPNVQISNRATRYARNIAITLLALTVIGVAVTFMVHTGIAGPASTMMVFAGGSALVMGGVYLGLRFGRDYLQKRKARKDWENFDKTDLQGKVQNLENGEALSKEIKLGKKMYQVTVIKGGKVTLKNK